MKVANLRTAEETSGALTDGSSRVRIDVARILEERVSADHDAEVVRRLYRVHRDTVYRLALRYGDRDPAFAEDVTQDVFVRLLEHFERLADPDDLGGWLYRVTTNRCLARLERRRVRSALLALWRFGRAEFDASVGPRIEARDELDAVARTLRTLPPKERAAFSMLHLDGLTQNEIADVLGHSKGYVSKLVHRAAQRIREAGWEVP